MDLLCQSSNMLVPSKLLSFDFLHYCQIHTKSFYQMPLSLLSSHQKQLYLTSSDYGSSL